MLPAHWKKCFFLGKRILPQRPVDDMIPELLWKSCVVGCNWPALVFCKTAEVPCAWSNKYLTCTVVVGEGGLYWFIVNHSKMRLLCCYITLERCFLTKLFSVILYFFFHDDTFASWLSPELSITEFTNTTCTILFPIYVRNNLALANEAHMMILKNVCKVLSYLLFAPEQM